MVLYQIISFLELHFYVIILILLLLDPNPNFAAYWSANQYKNLDIQPMKEVYKSYKVTVTSKNDVCLVRLAMPTDCCTIFREVKHWHNRSYL